MIDTARGQEIDLPAWNSFFRHMLSRRARVESKAHRKVTRLESILRSSAAFPEAFGPQDVFLSPHSDDICFSLGALAHRRHAGIHLTLFPYVRYVAKPGLKKVPGPVTALRMNEDVAFTTRCGLQPRFLPLADADLLGIPRYDRSSIEPCLARTESPLLEALADFSRHHREGPRPWLFCPMGIGGHMDHVATRMAVTRNLTGIARKYRVAFYEDLHYASEARVRLAGLADFRQDIPGTPMRRVKLPLGEEVPLKLSLLQGYSSQFAEVPRDIGAFTPGLADTPSP